jgi:hypothetical protein
MARVGVETKILSVVTYKGNIFNRALNRPSGSDYNQKSNSVTRWNKVLFQQKMLPMSENWKLHTIKIILGKLIANNFVTAQMFISAFPGVDTGTQRQSLATHTSFI